MQIKEKKQVLKVTRIQCDKCDKIIHEDEYTEFQEIISIEHSCGFGSIFGDGNKIELDFCQQCVKLILEKSNVQIIKE